MLYVKHKKLFAAVSIIISLFAVSSCGVWADFTTYFNTYYNAKNLFDNTEALVLQNKKDPFVFKEEKIQDAQSKDLTKVIEKCSKILQFDEESSYFDDALFITGKSFYYQQEYSKAQRKFIELTSIPESDYALENKLWLAKTYLQLRSFDEGLKLLDEVKTEALNAEDEEIFNRAAIAKIGFFVYRDEYASAVTEANSFLSSLDDEETAALVWYQLGKIYLLQKDEGKALQAFESVLKYSASFEIEFESRIEHAKLLGELGKLDESEEALIELRDEGKFKNQMDRILIEIGNIYFDKHEDEKAIEVFREVDSTYKKNPTAGIASMKLGEIYETRILDYDSAYAYYNKTSNSSADRELKLKAGQKARNMSKYFQLQSLLDGYELQFEYLTNNDRYIRDSIDFDIAYNQFLEENRKKQEESEQTGQQNKPVQQRSQQQTQQQQQQAQQQQTFTPTDKNLDLVTLISQGKVTKPVRPKISVDSIKTQIAQSYYNIGGMFFSEFEVPDSARFYYEEILEKFPSEKPYMVQTIYALGTYYETTNQKEKADSLFKIIYEKYPNNKLYREAAKKLGLLTEEDKSLLTETKDPAEKIYVKAEDFYYNKNYRAAIDSFKTIYLKYPRSNFTPKSIYYIGLIYEEQSKNDSAAFFYKILTTKEYLQTPYGKAVSAKYNEYKAEMEKIEKAKQEELQKQKELEELEKRKQQSQSDSLGVDSSKTAVPGDLEKRKVFDYEIKADSLDSKESRKKQSYPDRLKAEQADTTKNKVVDPELLKPEKIDSLRHKTAAERLKRAESDSTIEKKILPKKLNPGEKDTAKVRTIEPE